MSRRTTSVVALLAVVAVLAVVPLVAQRGGGARGGGGGMPMPTTRLGMLTMALALSDQQKKDIKKTLDDDFKAAAPLREALTKTRLALGQAVQTTKTPGELDDATTRYAEQASAMAQAEIKAIAKVLKLLTEDQRANEAAMRWMVSMSRGMLADKKWDTSPDHRFY